MSALKAWPYFLILLITILDTQVLAQCSLICNESLVTIALGENGSTELLPSYFLDFRSAECQGEDEVVLLSTGDSYVDCTMVGNVYEVRVTNTVSGNYCSGQVKVVDRLFPILSPINDVTIHCHLSYGDTSITGSPIVEDNCDFLLTYTDDLSALNDCELGLVERTWTAEDATGNSTQYIQNITIIDTIPPVINFPDDISIHCDVRADDLSITGRPTFSDNCGQLDASYVDRDFDACGGDTRRILREWTVVDFCDPNGPYGIFDHVQIVVVNDTVAPTISCGADVTVNTNESSSFRVFTDTTRLTITENCGSIEVDTLVRSFEGDTIEKINDQYHLPFGTNTFRYIASDGCGNRDTCTRLIEVIDEEDPMLTCIPSINVSLSSDTSYLFPKSFYRDASDNVTPSDSLEKYFINNGDSLDRLPIYCSIVGPERHSVMIRVVDESGNFNQCEVTYQVSDVDPPRLVCPLDLSLTCSESLENLPEPSASDNCSYELSYLDDETQLNSCGLGDLYRVWAAEDPSGNKKTCTQVIHIVSDSDPVFHFPQDTIIYCGNSELPSSTGDVIIENACSNLIRSYTDEIFTGSQNIVKRIRRTFFINDECDPNFDLSATQTISVQDTSKPHIHVPHDSIIYVEHGSCQATIHLPIELIDACRGAYSIDHNLESANLNGQILSGALPLGDFTFQIFADDGYQNKDTATLNIRVLDSIPPQARCQLGLAIDLNEDDFIEIDASLLDAGSSDNCSDTNELSYSLSRNSFNCRDLGLNDVLLNIMDESGNVSRCTTTVEIQDLNHTCVIKKYDVSGTIYDKSFIPVEGIEIFARNDMDTFYTNTNEDGTYIFTDVMEGSAMEIWPMTGGDLGQGISSIDLILLKLHLLERNTFDDPFAYLASDVNNNGSVSIFDYSYIKSVLLEQVNSWSAGGNIVHYKSGEGYYGDPLDILNDVHTNQSIVISSIENDMDAVDFIVNFKGDINNSGMENWAQSRMDCDDSNFYFDLNAGEYQVGEKLSFTLKTRELRQIFAIQFTTAFDPDCLEYDAIRCENCESFNEDFDVNLDSDRINVVHTPNNSFSAMPGDELVQIDFIAKRNIQWPECIEISNDEVVVSINNSIQAEPICTDQLNTNLEENSIINHRVFPNPSSGIFNFRKNDNSVLLDKIVLLSVNGAAFELEVDSSSGDGDLYRFEWNQKGLFLAIFMDSKGNILHEQTLIVD